MMILIGTKDKIREIRADIVAQWLKLLIMPLRKQCKMAQELVLLPRA